MNYAIVWKGSSAPGSLKHSYEETHRKVYYEKVLKTSNEKHLNKIGYNTAANEVMNGNAIVYSHATPFLILPEYPCGIIEVPSLT